MTVKERNEAAERLRDAIWTAPNDLGLYVKDLDEALAAERRATVERITKRVIAIRATSKTALSLAVLDILHEEAAR